MVVKLDEPDAVEGEEVDEEAGDAEKELCDRDGK